MSEKKFQLKIKDPTVVGIDLGTTNSAVSFMKNNIPLMVKNDIGTDTLPSIVQILDKKMNAKIGHEAQKNMISDKSNTIFASKRLIGRKFDDCQISDYLKNLPYKTVSSCNGDVWIKTDYGKISPVHVGAKILANLKALTEKMLGKKVQRAVVTVPAYFNDSQRQATKEAGKLAGLDVIRIINEPTAAALAYGLGKVQKGHIAVYDLGGGTFDISILELRDGIFHVKATNGDTFLGGEDFDNEFVNFLLHLHETQENRPVERTPEVLQLLKIHAEKAKKELSEKEKTRICIEDVVPGADLDLVVSRQQLESIAKKIANRTVTPCEQAIKDANLSKSEIDHVILVGGMTRMPFIRKLVEETFGMKPNTSIDPDLAVAQGAAIQAGILSGDVKNILLLDVAPLSLGIEILGGMFSKIVERNTTIPFKHTEVFSTSEDNQTEVDIHIYQGERQFVKQNKYLGSIKLQNIPKAPRGVPKINVCFEADANGIIKVSAEDSISKKMQTINIAPTKGMTKADAKRIVRDAKKNKHVDNENIKKAKILGDIEMLERKSAMLKDAMKISIKLANVKKMILDSKLNNTDAAAAVKELKDKFF
ncbi:molecular chaperone DnaK [Enteropsectra breve]|nr:molecular chaperone DnaK [Enteropsectra breve]